MSEKENNNVEDIKKAKRSDLVRILVADDSDLSRQTIVSILEEEGYNVVAQANNAENAIQNAFTSGANVFLIDVVMPEVSGLDLANHIRDNIKDPRIIMMSTLDVEHVIIESVSSGAVDFLAKPFDKDELLKSIEKIEYEIEKEAQG